MKTSFHAVVTLCVIATLLPFAGRFASGQERAAQRAEVRGVIKSVDFNAPSITVVGSEGRGAAVAEKTYPLAKSVELAVGGINSGRGGVFREGQLADLTTGTNVVLTLTADGATVESIVAEGPSVRGICKAVDAANRTITITQQGLQRGEATPDETYAVPEDAEIAIDDGRGRRFSIKEGKLADLVPGSIVAAQLSIDKKQALGILAEGTSIAGIIKSVNADSITITLRPARGTEQAEERIVSVTPETGVLLDDGRGRRLSVKVGKLGDIPTGSQANVRLGVNGATATSIRVEGPVIMGLLKGVNAAAKTITLAFPRGRGEAPEEKTFTLAEGARMLLEGGEIQLDALKPAENGPFAMLRLSLDQKSVQHVNARQPGTR